MKRRIVRTGICDGKPRLVKICLVCNCIGQRLLRLKPENYVLPNELMSFVLCSASERQETIGYIMLHS